MDEVVAGDSAQFDPLACYRCGVHGHLARDCPSSSTQSQTLGSAVLALPGEVRSNPGNQAQSEDVAVDDRFDLGYECAVRFEGNEYPVDDFGQLYVPLGYEQTGVRGRPRGKREKYKKLKRSYASVAAAGATCDSAGVGPLKENKNWRESVKYLHSRSDRARFWRREGSVVIVDMVALRQAKEKEDAGQRRQQGVAVGYCSCGAAYPSRAQRGGNRNARRKRQRASRERLRGERVVSRVLAQSLSSLKGGSDSRNSETIGRLQKLQQFAAPSAENQKEISQSRTNPCT